MKKKELAKLLGKEVDINEFEGVGRACDELNPQRDKSATLIDFPFCQMVAADVINPRQIQVTLDDIGGLESIKKNLVGAIQ